MVSTGSTTEVDLSTTEEPALANASTSPRVTVPSGPVGVIAPRSMPRSLASLRTGGLASARASDGVVAFDGTSAWATSAGALVRAEVAGTAGSSAPSTSGEGPGSKAPWICALAAPAPASTPAVAADFRDRRIAVRSALLRPTRLSPSPPPEARGLDRSISISA